MINSSSVTKKLSQSILQFEDKFCNQLSQHNLLNIRGRVLESTSLIIRASIPEASLGQICHITIRRSDKKSLLAQVVGFKDDDVFLMPLGSTEALGPKSEVIPTNKPFFINVGYSLLGRVLDGLGQPMDGGPELGDIPNLMEWPLFRRSPDPYKRKPIKEPMPLGIRAIDALTTVGKGQRLGLFAGSGVGKSSLIGQMVRNTEAPVVVVCLVGERGREVREFLEHSLGSEGLKKSVVVVATSDTPSLIRYLSCHVATAIAEWFRMQKCDVLLVMDSITRFARAQREIGLALGEPPARQGYPPSVFAEIPKLLERTGTDEHGSITAIYTVLVQGSDFDEPISDEVRGVLDGHIILSRNLSDQGHWPAIDILPSLSRIMPNVINKDHMELAQRLRRILAAYEKNRDLILLGAYRPGTDKEVDLAITIMPKVLNFLRQPIDERACYKQTVTGLLSLFETNAHA